MWQLIPFLEVFVQSSAAAFTTPSFVTHCEVLLGWLMCIGRRTEFRVFETIQADKPVRQDQRHPFDRFYNFFNRSAWEVGELARHVMIQLVVTLKLHGELTLVVDDTLLHKSGSCVFGIGWFHDPVASTGERSVSSMGNNWVVMALVFKVPFADKQFCLPVHAKLRRAGDEHPGPAELALEMLNEVTSWFPDRKFRLLGDGGYSSGKLLKHIPEQVTYFGLMRMDAALHETEKPKRKPGRSGPNYKYGKRLPSPRERAKLADRKHASRGNRWTRISLELFGEERQFDVLSFQATWPKVFGNRVIQVVYSRALDTGYDDVCLYTTDLNSDPAQVIETYSQRTSIEGCFKDSKQVMQIDKPQHWSRESIEKLSPWVWLAQTTVTLWYLASGRKTHAAKKFAKRDGDWDSEWSLRRIMRLCRREIIQQKITTTSDKKPDLHQLINELENYLFLAG